MSGSDFINQHIYDAVYAAVAEANGYEDEAKRLNAQTKLRLLMMSDEEVEELARMMAYLPDMPVGRVVAEIRQAIAGYRETADKWICDI